MAYTPLSQRKTTTQTTIQTPSYDWQNFLSKNVNLIPQEPKDLNDAISQVLKSRQQQAETAKTLLSKPPTEFISQAPKLTLWQKAKEAIGKLFEPVVETITGLKPSERANVLMARQFKEEAPEGVSIKVPFAQVQIPMQRNIVTESLKSLVEWPETAVKDLAQTYEVFKTGEIKKEPITGKISVDSVFENMAKFKQDAINQGADETTATYASMLYGAGQGIFDMVVLGDLFKLGAQGLLRGTEKSIARKEAWDILGRPATIEEAQTQRNVIAHKFHPDKGLGNENLFKTAQSAYEVLKKEGIPTIVETRAVPTLRQYAKQLLSPVGAEVTGEAMKTPLIAGELPGYRPVGGKVQPRIGLQIEEIEPVGKITTKEIIVDEEAEIAKLNTAKTGEKITLNSYAGITGSRDSGFRSPSKDVAQAYAYGKGGEVFQKTDTLNNPYVATDQVQVLRDLGREDLLAEAREEVRKTGSLAPNKPIVIKTDKAINEMLSKQGYDGVIYTNFGRREPEYQVFKPTPIEQKGVAIKPEAEKGIIPQVSIKKPPVKPPTKFERKALGIPEEIMITKPEKQLLKLRIRAEARGAKEGFKVAKQITTEELKTAFRESRQNALKTREILREFIKQEIPAEEQGKFLSALTNEISKAKQVKIMTRVEDLKERIRVRKIVGELKEPIRGNIAVDYQKKITEALTGIDLKKPTDKTIKKLTSLKDYIKENGVPLGITQKRIDDLERLTKKNVSQMTSKELQEIRDQVKFLEKMGKLKQELKFKYVERERKLALQKLLYSTKNIDPKTKPIEGKLGAYDVYKVGTTKAYLETIQPPRVADIIDGLQNYKGENAKYVKRFARAEQTAKIEHQKTMVKALQEMADAGIKDLTQEQQLNIMINIRNREGAYDQVKTLLDKAGMKEIPTLTDKEEKVIQILKKYVNKQADDIGAIYEEIENKPFNKLDEYVLPLKYEKEFNILPSETIEQTRYRTTQTFKGFVYERQKGVTEMPRTDLLGIFDEAINDQQWYINIQPELENIKYLVKSEEYANKAGQLATTFWKDYMDMIARRGWSATAKSNAMLRQTRLNIQQAVLAYKLTSIVMQPFAIFDALAYTQAKHGSTAALQVLYEFSKSWIVPKYAKSIIAKSEALQLRRGGEVAIEEIWDQIEHPQPGRISKFIPPAIREKLFKPIKEKGLALLQWADLQTAAGVQQGLEKVLTKRGIENSKDESEFLMNMVSGSSEIAYRPLIISKGEGARTVFTFQNFFLNRWGIIAHDLVKSGLLKGKITENWGKRFSALIGLGIIMAAAVAEQKTRNFIIGLTTGKEQKPISTLKTAMMAIPEQVPLFGNMVSSFLNYGDAGFDFPLSKEIETIIGGLGVITKKTPEAKAKAITKATEAITTVVAGIPGTAQFFDILERIFLTPKKEGIEIPNIEIPSIEIPSINIPNIKL